MTNDSVYYRQFAISVRPTVEQSSTHTDFADFMKSQESFNTKMMVMLEQLLITSKEKEIALRSKNSSDEAIDVDVYILLNVFLMTMTKMAHYVRCRMFTKSPMNIQKGLMMWVMLRPYSGQTSSKCVLFYFILQYRNRPQ